MTRKITNHREVDTCFNCKYASLEDYYYDEYNIKCTRFRIITHDRMICASHIKEKET